MELDEYLISRYDGVLPLLPYGLRERLRSVSSADRKRTEEIRLRLGHAPSIVMPDGEISIGGEVVARRDLDGVLDLVTRVSAHSVQSSMAQGFVTARGGYRVGICGTIVLSDGVMTGYRTISSVAVRISRGIVGAADNVIKEIAPDGKICSTLIISPPGVGKTTLLRDVVRYISDTGTRVAIADERGEIAALCDGVPQMDVGTHTDVLDACPKAHGVMLLLRAMNPEVIAVDEITAPEDITAALGAANCGVKLLATAHANGLPDLKLRALYRGLFEAGVFEKAVIISKKSGKRQYDCVNLEI